MLALGCHETAPDIDSVGMGKCMFCVVRSSLLSPLLPGLVKANVLFLTMFVKTFRSKMYPRAGFAVDGERGDH